MSLTRFSFSTNCLVSARWRKFADTVQKSLKRDFMPEEGTDKQAIVAATADRVKIEP